MPSRGIRCRRTRCLGGRLRRGLLSQGHLITKFRDFVHLGERWVVAEGTLNGVGQWWNLLNPCVMGIIGNETEREEYL